VSPKDSLFPYIHVPPSSPPSSHAHPRRLSVPTLALARWFAFRRTVGSKDGCQGMPLYATSLSVSYTVLCLHPFIVMHAMSSLPLRSVRSVRGGAGGACLTPARHLSRPSPASPSRRGAPRRSHLRCIYFKLSRLTSTHCIEAHYFPPPPSALVRARSAHARICSRGQSAPFRPSFHRLSSDDIAGQTSAVRRSWSEPWSLVSAGGRRANEQRSRGAHEVAIWLAST
jgi:hypothetical protein